ncbi:4-hydroxymandelate synthase [Kitasatospora gansuensis]|uniref:4-hydroxymandelate synthase n=1 Tax=Kitasatospora gansuensis TaxID=258050 RepID=A0A7W7S6L7_9ACTN|nr:4-hydroxyphenylpyruvate dioxygenase [Kitasatospora gansuensis]MBB4944672.1 4-hydroxymandelate synthase [Kitasatospora gansuensis]
MTIQSIAHVEFHCADADLFAAYLVEAYAFTREPPVAAEPGVRRVWVRQGTIRLLLSSAGQPDHPVAEFVARHGDGVAVFALGCADPAAALDRALRNGARPLAPGLVAGFGDVALRFVPEPEQSAPTADLLQFLDHAALCVPAGELAGAVKFCEQALGFRRIFDEYIEVGAQAMDSSVVQSPSGLVTFTLIEPDTARSPGQIDTFLDRHEGSGVQHLAFHTGDITTAVRELAGRGVEFLSTPQTYYDALPERIGATSVPVTTLRELNVLVDQDHGGQLYQIFTRSAHDRRTFFLELIERQGAGTFGSANIRALYEAVERQQTATTTAPAN